MNHNGLFLSDTTNTEGYTFNGWVKKNKETTMIIKKYERNWMVELLDDGTMDTVVRVRPDSEGAPWQEVRFSPDYAAYHRNEKGEVTPDGFQALGEEAVEEYNELDAYLKTGWV